MFVLGGGGAGRREEGVVPKINYLVVSRDSCKEKKRKPNAYT